MRTKVIQTNFTGGEISPTLAGRIDLDKYYKSCATAENVIIMPHGGLKRRDGLAKVTDTYINKYCRLEPFVFNITQTYLIAIATDYIHIYKDGVEMATIASPFTTQAMVDTFDTVQTADTMLFTHEDLQPLKLVRQGSDTSWALSEIEFTNIPKYDFNPDIIVKYENTGEDLTVSLAAGEIVYNNDGDDIDGLTGFLFEAATTLTDVNLSTTDFCDDSLWTCLGIRDNVWGQTLIESDYTNTGASQVVDLSKGDIIYNNDGNNTNGLNLHFYGCKKNIPSANLATIDYTDTTNFKDMGVQDTTDRGWPKTLTFHGGRLWFGGSKSKPQTVWGSVSNDFFNFDMGEGLDDESIFDTIDTDQYNSIQSIFSGRNLQVFTSSGEFYNKATIITPKESVWLAQTGYGSARIRPLMIDGTTLFVSRNTKALRQFLYNYTEDAYVALNALLMSEHLATNGIKTIDAQRATLDNVSDLVYAIDNSGACLVLNVMRTEEILGWTKWTTNGTFIDVAVVGDIAYFLVKRGTGYYIEALTPATYTDHNTVADGTGLTSIDTNEEGPVLSMAHKVVTDGSVQNDATPDAGGVITISRPASHIEVGLGYTVNVETMPIAFNGSDGTQVNSRKRVLKTTLRIYNTKGAYVQGKLLRDKKFPLILNQTPDPYTGALAITHLGYNNINSVTVTQEDPLPFHLLQIESETEA